MQKEVDLALAGSESHLLVTDGHPPPVSHLISVGLQGWDSGLQRQYSDSVHGCRFPCLIRVSPPPTPGPVCTRRRLIREQMGFQAEGHLILPAAVTRLGCLERLPGKAGEGFRPGCIRLPGQQARPCRARLFWASLACNRSRGCFCLCVKLVGQNGQESPPPKKKPCRLCVWGGLAFC